MRLRSIQLAERKVQADGAPVCVYLFIWESNAMETPFLFSNPDIAPFTGEDDDGYELAASMGSTWVNFARND